MIELLLMSMETNTCIRSWSTCYLSYPDRMFDSLGLLLLRSSQFVIVSRPRLRSGSETLRLSCELSDYLRVKMASMMAYSIIALKILQMHVTMNLSIALRLLDPEDGALSLS